VTDVGQLGPRPGKSAGRPAPVQVGLLGLGTVGCGTVQVLRRNGGEIARRAGREIVVSRAAVRDLTKPRPCETKDLLLTDDPRAVVDDPDLPVLVELMGGIEPTRELLLRAIARGKHIVTANKALIALHGNELFDAAQAHGVMVAFEAAVAGGIPIIKAVREGLAGNRIDWLAGIINGTSNFILSEMTHKGRDFDEALMEAQRLGYAEADPTFDVEGVDAAHKLTILAAIAFGIPLRYASVYREGISGIRREDVDYARQLGYRIKHLGIARRSSGGIELRVHPTLIPDGRPLADVDGVMNGILVCGDAVGPTLYYGPGAGAEPTASAVVADLVDVVRTLTSDPENRVPHLAFRPDALEDLPIVPMGQVDSSYYLRMQAVDRPGVLADVTRILGDRGISIEAILQKEPRLGQDHVPIIMLTHRVAEREMADAIQRIEALDSIEGRLTRIRLEHF
jgi:homoserine dehydrogenase